jgi:hypothetical protein
MPKLFGNRRPSEEENADELLSAYLDDALTLEERATVEARLRQEPQWVTRLEGLRQTKKAQAGLPEAELPRNFILSPSMVAPEPKPETRPRTRQRWPVFGWATAAVTLLFLVVFASDIFVLSPSVAPTPEAPVAQPLARESMEESVDALPEAEAPAEAMVEEAVSEADDAARESAEAKVPVTLEAEVQAQPPAEAPVTAAEAEGTIGEAMPMETMAAEADALPREATSMTLQAGSTPAKELQMTQDEEEAELRQAPAVGGAATPTPMVEAIVIITEDADATRTIIPSPSPPVEASSREKQPALSPEAIAIQPLDVTPTTASGDRVADDVLSVLRVVEVGLGAAVLCLLAVTLVLRRREGRGY